MQLRRKGYAIHFLRVHAVLADGYGYGYDYNSSTLYHHLNMGWDSQGTRMMWDIFIHKDKHSIRFSRVGSYPPCGGRVLPIGQWSHVAATFDGTTLIFYIDGEETGRGDFSFGTKIDSTIIIGAVNLNGGGRLPRCS